MEFTLVLTHACNLACTYCYAGRKSPRQMPLETGQRALRWIFERLTGQAARETDTKTKPKIQVGYFGGEPLLAWNLLCRLQVFTEELAAQHEIELTTTATTNATLLTEEKQDWLAAHRVRVALRLHRFVAVAAAKLRDLLEPLV